MRLLNLVFILFMYACHSSETAPPEKTDTLTAADTVIVTGDGKLNPAVHTNAFTQIGDSGVLVFPLVHTAGSNDDYGSFSGGGREGNNWNIIFYNSKTGNYHLLSDSLKMLIWDYSVQGDNDKSGSSDSELILPNPPIISDGFIFYKITVKDYNNDKTLTSEDPTYLFVTDKEGNRLRQLSPSNCNLLSFEYIQASGKVLMDVVKDSDNDKTFSDKDEKAWYELKLNEELQPHEIFRQDFKNKMKLLYHKYWTKIK